jgi:DNA-binding XRE family transcriptional regulator
MTVVLEKTNTTVLLSRDGYELLLDALEDERDARALAELRLREAAGTAEYVPIELVDRIAAGEHPVRVWREYRKLTVGELAKHADVAQGYLSEIEAGKKPGSVRALAAIAKTLRIDIEDLLLPEREGP